MNKRPAYTRSFSTPPECLKGDNQELDFCETHGNYVPCECWINDPVPSTVDPIPRHIQVTGVNDGPEDLGTCGLVDYDNHPEDQDAYGYVDYEDLGAYGGVYNSYSYENSLYAHGACAAGVNPLTDWNANHYGGRGAAQQFPPGEDQHVPRPALQLGQFDSNFNSRTRRSSEQLIWPQDFINIPDTSDGSEQLSWREILTDTQGASGGSVHSAQNVHGSTKQFTSGQNAPNVPAANSPTIFLPDKKYKTELCYFHRPNENISCPRGLQCRFAHGEEELRPRPDLPRNIRKESCRNTFCNYGNRCHYKHAEHAEKKK